MEIDQRVRVRVYVRVRDTVIRGITEIFCVLRHQFLPLQDYKNTKRVRVRVRIVHVYVHVHHRG